MSLRRDAQADTLTSSAPTSVQDFTICGYSYIVSDRGAVEQPVVRITSTVGGDAIAAAFWDDSAGNISALSFDGTNVNNNSGSGQPAVGGWFHWYLRCSGSAAGQLEFGVATLTDAGYSTVATQLTATAAGRTPSIVHYGLDAINNWSQIRYAHVRAWNAVLTNEELAFERHNNAAVRLANLIFDCPADHGSTALAVLDYSGNGSNLSQTSITIEDNSPIGDILESGFDTWFAAAAGGATLAGSSTTSAAGTLAPAADKALSGQAATASAGATTPVIALALSGAAGTSAAGAVSPDLSVELSGASITIDQGSITASTGGDVTAALSGQSDTAAQGTVSPASDLALAGGELAWASGTTAPATSASASGAAASSATGTATPESAVALSGANVAIAQGSVTPIVGITIELTGQSGTLSNGSLVGDLSALLSGQQGSLSFGSVSIASEDDGFSGEYARYRRQRKERATKTKIREVNRAPTRQHETEEVLALLMLM